MKIHGLVLTIAVASMLAACASAPKPPTVNGRDRVKINTPRDQHALAMQVFPDRPQEAALLQGNAPASSTVSIHFPWNDARFRISRRQAAELQSLLRSGYVRVAVRGRTDATRPSAGDETIAARRAAAARDWLIHQGVPAIAITTNYASAADPLAGNNYSGGRALNRRVDIEIIRR
ncbi:OmpA family protein (plasmid) [Agrobacterium sp. rho-13.3]|uniref:OmpA family protein n=1 Tax=Agrobacterium sp. rho-13.3 TaxID=3072980 RepID=UPI002A166A7F|nr:OmpA family protein [Agrobacterium sp. rho-13.3]MDX8311519.1 OmpA family protein [Agrobacterium sp. rho-13.3]